MNSRFIHIILAIMLVLLVFPFIRPLGLTGHLVSALFVALIPLSSVYALTGDKKTTMVIFLFATPFVVLDALIYFFPSRLLLVVAYSCASFLYFYIVFLLVKNLLSITVVTSDLIYCAIATFLLIGIGWAGVYTVVEAVSPGSFSAETETGDLLYFSFVTLTTLGYGDILPTSILGKRLAVIEAAMGSIYMAVIIALIVGRYISMHLDDGPKD